MLTNVSPILVKMAHLVKTPTVMLDTNVPALLVSKESIAKTVSQITEVSTLRGLNVPG